MSARSIKTASDSTGPPSNAPGIVFSRDELWRCLPHAGRYHATIHAVTPSEAGIRPAELLVTWAVCGPALRPRIYDRFVLRGPLRHSLPGLRRLLGLLHLASIAVQPETPVDLGRLIGLACLIDVETGLDPGGFPYSIISCYQLPIAVPHATAPDLRNQPCRGAARPPRDTCSAPSQAESSQQRE